MCQSCPQQKSLWRLNKAEEKDETIVRVLVDDIENNVDLNDDDSDISLDYIDKVEVYTSHIDDVSANIIVDFKTYFENVLLQLPAISEKLITAEKLDAVDNIYQVVEGVKQLNIAFNSMAQMGKIDIDQKNESGSSLNDVLVKVNDVIIDLIDKMKLKNWEDAKDLLDFDLALKTNELIDFFPTIEMKLRGDK